MNSSILRRSFLVGRPVPRNISLNIDYEDVLSADSFSAALLEEE